jgi:hypothetical protein
MNKFYSVFNVYLNVGVSKSFSSSTDAQTYAEELAISNPGKTYVVMESVCALSVPLVVQEERIL